MLERLHIKNAALIASCEMEFSRGLHILTGETGAGKSMLIDSLNFVLGGRTGKEFIRRGEKMVSVEAVFSYKSAALSSLLAEDGIEEEEDGTLLLSRTLNDAGKSVSRVNGSVVTISMLREIGSFLVDIHGQHEHQSLLHPAKHIQLLDRFCGEALENTLVQYQENFRQFRRCEKELSELLAHADSAEQRLDYLRFQEKEIAEADLKNGEEEELLAKKKILANAERLIRLSEKATAVLYDGVQEVPSAYDQLGAGMNVLEEIAQIDETAASFAQKAGEAYELLDDCIRAFRHYADNLEADEEGLEMVEERLQLIYRLKKKYGGSVENVLSHLQEVQDEIAHLSDSTSYAAKLEKEKAAYFKQIEAYGNQLTKIRQEKARWIEGEIEKHLRDMEMKNARFAVSILSDQPWTSSGRDKVEFLISANAGEDLKPLAKIASGGEMSRVMLALKTVLSDADEIDTFIFDEIDTGVSGKTARKVAEKWH